MPTRYFRGRIVPLFSVHRPFRPGRAKRTEENKMSLIKSALVAGGMSLALMTGALAQGNDPWDIKERTAYVVMMDGTMKTMRISDDGMKMLMKKAKKVPRGMVFFMNNGQLYMVQASSMFDRSSGGALFSR
jgi:hypothetical protein